MKQFFGMLLMVFSSSSAFALSIQEVSCAGSYGHTLNLVRGEDDTMRGWLQDAYNSAEIICEQGGWGSLTYQAPMKCVGVWSSGFDANGNAAMRTVEIEMRIGTTLPNATATYVKNWDGRKPVSTSPKVLNCTVNLP